MSIRRAKGRLPVLLMAALCGVPPVRAQSRTEVVQRWEAMEAVQQGALEFLERLHDDDECRAAFTEHRPSIRNATLHAELVSADRLSIAKLFDALDSQMRSFRRLFESSMATDGPLDALINLLRRYEHDSLPFDRSLVSLRDAIEACTGVPGW